jgi:predicted glycoside hydrolase/deacetylase ChbG (UPF0249 family)
MVSRYLIINADDFGISEKTNIGIIEARQKGVVTSASLMVHRPAAEAAAQYACRDQQLSVGLHADMGDWVYEGEHWLRSSGTLDICNPNAVDRELRHQLQRFRDLLGRDPTHLDSHQHIHKEENILPVFSKLADELAIPLRSYSPKVQYCGAFFGADEEMKPRFEIVGSANFIRLLDHLPTGVTELGTHPGLDIELASDYCGARLAEVRTLCDPAIRQAIADRRIVLTSFATLGPHSATALPANTSK